MKSYKTIRKTHDTNPSHTRIRHPTDSSSLPTPDDTPQNRTLKSHYKLRQQSRKDYRIFHSPSNILNHGSFIIFRDLKSVTSNQDQL